MAATSKALKKAAKKLGLLDEVLGATTKGGVIDDATAEIIERGKLGLLDDSVEARMKRAKDMGLSNTGYHATNADKFDSFDLSKLGTGAGGKDTKHGFYFSGRPKTADAYRETYLSIKPEKFKEYYGLSLDDAQDQYDKLGEKLASKGYNIDKTL